MEVLPPCVQDCSDADICTKMPVIGSNGGKSLGRGLEEQSIDFRLVLICDRTDCARKGEDQVTISNR